VSHPSWYQKQNRVHSPRRNKTLGRADLLTQSKPESGSLSPPVGPAGMPAGLQGQPEGDQLTVGARSQPGPPTKAKEFNISRFFEIYLRDHLHCKTRGTLTRFSVPNAECILMSSSSILIAPTPNDCGRQRPGTLHYPDCCDARIWPGGAAGVAKRLDLAEVSRAIWRLSLRESTPTVQRIMHRRSGLTMRPAHVPGGHSTLRSALH
jgi:hypothetical protein